MDNMAKERICVRNAGGFLNMSDDVLKDAPFGIVSPDARNVRYIAISMI